MNKELNLASGVISEESACVCFSAVEWQLKCSHTKDVSLLLDNLLYGFMASEARHRNLHFQ